MQTVEKFSEITNIHIIDLMAMSFKGLALRGFQEMSWL